MSLVIVGSKQGGVVVVRVGGELDIVTASDLWSQLSCWINGGEVRFLIDCAGITFLDCSGMGSLVRCLNVVGPLGGWMRLCHVSPWVFKILTVAGLAETFLDGDGVPERPSATAGGLRPQLATLSPRGHRGAAVSKP